MKPRRFLCSLLALSILSAGLPALAQSDSGEIAVTVVDAKTSAGVPDARVILTGPTIASTLTTKAGIVRYLDVPSGIYRVRVFRTAYAGTSSDEFQVLGGKLVTLRIQLAAAEALRVIGSIVAKSSVTVNATDIGEDSPVRRLSDSLTDALDKLAGVNVTQDTNDPNAAVTVSLRGRDESQTGITLDGIPLAAPGSAANLRSINTDVFSGARASFSPSAGSLGGSVNFRTLEPTQSWQQRLAASYGTFDRANYSVATTGSLGRLGLALQHTWRGANNPLTFNSYVDQSGLNYAHGGETTSTGDFLKLRLRVGDRTTLSGSALSSNNSVSPLCTSFVTNLPCGIGPGNRNSGHFGFAYGTIGSLIGNIAAQATAYASTNRNDTDFLQRYLGGNPAPLSSTQVTAAHGLALSASIAQRRHTFTLSGSTYDATTTFQPNVAGRFVTASKTASSSYTAQLSDSLKANDKLSLSARTSLAGTTGSGTSLLAGAGLTWRPTSRDTFDGSLSFGSAQPANGIVRTLSDPASARFNCAAGTSLVSGPGDQPAGQSSASADVAWTHTWGKGSFTLDAYRQTQAGQLVYAQINALGEPAGFFPTGYIAALANVWNSPFICGGTPFNAGGVYVSQPIGGTARTYQGVDFSARIALGKNAVALPTYSVNSAVLTAADARLTSANSTTIVGQQIPGRPVHRAGLTVDALLAKSGLELLANAQYTGPNNYRRLGPFTVVSTGLSHSLAKGRLTLFANNLFNADAGEFSTLQYSQPLPLASGGSLPTAANPLLPRQYTLTYQLNFGRGSSAPASSLQQSAQDGASRRRGPQFSQRDFTARPPGADPLALATDRPICDADAQKTAAPFMSALRAYVNAYEAGNASPLEPPGVTVTPHRLAAANPVPWYLELRLPAPVAGASPTPAPQVNSGTGQRPPGAGGFNRRLRAVFVCSYVTFMTYDDAKAKGIEPPTTPTAMYAPQIGLFFIRPQELPAGGGSVRRP